MKKFLLSAAAALFACTTLSAQDKGDWEILPRLNIYTATGGDAVFGLGAAARYNLTDAVRLEPGLTFLLHKGCSVDFNCDVHYLFHVAPSWNVFPLAGIGVNDFGNGSMGINLGAGADYKVADRWSLTAGVKYMIQTAKFTIDNPVIVTVGGSYRF